MGAPTIDRRKSLRIEIIEDLRGRPIPQKVALKVHDISDEGFSVYAPVGFAPGIQRRFEFSENDRVIGILDATNVHSLRMLDVDGQPTFLCGFTVDLTHHYTREVFRQVHPTQRASGVGGYRLGTGSTPSLTAFDRK